MRTRALLVGGIVTVAAIAIPHPAGASDRPTVELALEAGGATNPTPDPLNPLGFALGARAGVSWFGVYGGLAVTKFFGSTGPVPNKPSSFTESNESLTYGFDLGYTFDISGRVAIRPLLGFGGYTLTSSTGMPSPTWSTVYLEPRIAALVTLGTFFVGADGGALVLPNSWQNDCDRNLAETCPGPASTEVAFVFEVQVGARL